MRRRTLGLVVLALGAAASAALAGGKKKHDVTTPADFIKMMEKSKVHYVVGTTSELKDVGPPGFADLMWPLRSKSLEMPYVRRRADGGLSLTTYPESADAKAALDEVEPLFRANDFAAATTGYLKVLEKYPDMYRAHLYLGDAYFLGPKDNDKALAEYREAIRLNPFDAVGYAFAGHALIKLRRNDEALDAWVRALTLHPYHETTMKLASQFGQALGIKPHLDRFRPHALVRREGDNVAIHVDPDYGTHWMSWAICKAVWLGEPGYGKEHGAPEAGEWGSAEDYECMAHLLITYDLDRKDGKSKEEPELERLRPLLDDHLLDEFVVYEFGSRVTPDAPLLADPSQLEMEKFVRGYVLPKAPVSAVAPSAP